MAVAWATRWQVGASTVRISSSLWSRREEKGAVGTPAPIDLPTDHVPQPAVRVSSATAKFALLFLDFLNY